jgi:hypothetical protein
VFEEGTGIPGRDRGDRPTDEQYEELELRVIAYSKEKLEVSGVCFGPERFYICGTSN